MNETGNYPETTGLEIAVIGMSGRFPGAADTEQYWENLKNGVESITFFTREELEAKDINRDLLDDPNYIMAKGILTDVEFFDASFFGYTAVESELMDPQTRVFYECAYWALENAGYSPYTYEKNIGVFAGATNNRMWEMRAILSGKTTTLGTFGSDHLIDRDFLSTRIAYRLNLKGPAITLKTACSTSLVAVDLACRMLLTGQCDIALAGGVSIPSTDSYGYLYREGMIASPDGHCRAFDAKAKGVVFSDGIAIAVLKRLTEAIADRDNIWAVIKGSAINNDGSRKGSYSSPGIEGQAVVIRAAQKIAEVAPETIDYVETHGTGTTLGDPIEIDGLKMAFATDKRKYCAIGSVKTNIGHLDTAAGIASFLKTVLAIHHKYIPPSLHFEKPNPKIDFENSPFYVNTKLREWKRGPHPRRAGVSSFGVGGTNAHVILEEAPPREPSSKSRKNQLIVLSAKTVNALDQAAENLRAYFSQHPYVNLADAAYTLQVGRSAFKYRQMVIAPSTEDVIACLASNGTASFDAEKVMRGTAMDEVRPIFMFSGQGSQYVNMGLEIYNEEPAFALEMDRCFTIFSTITGYNIKDILYPPGHNSQGQEQEKGPINQTEMTQPVIFIFAYALARLLMKWGIVPYAMIGHSIGEYVAACLAGVFSLEDAIKIVILRGKLMQKMPPGAMLGIPLTEAEVIPLLGNGVELAAVNAPALCVVSGPSAAINRLEEDLNVKGIQARPLYTSHAFHSSMMEPILDEFERGIAPIILNPPQIPYISNLTGTWIKVEEATDPAYWARHLRRAVRFADGLSVLLKEENALLIDVGPGQTLSTFARQHIDRKPAQPVVNLVRRPKDNVSDSFYLLNKIGRIWLTGQKIDWKAFYEHEIRYRMPLPLYPFQRQRFWISRNVYDNLGARSINAGAPLTKKKPDEWFYLPSWKRSLIPGPAQKKNLEPLNWLFFIDECGVGTQLIGGLKGAGHHISIVTAGTGFGRKEGDQYEIAIQSEADYDLLIDALLKEGKRPHKIVHLWNVTRADDRDWGCAWDELYLEKGFYSLLYLPKTIGKKNISEEIDLVVFTNRAQPALGNEELSPEKAVIMGPVNVIPQELPNMHCRTVDIVLSRSDGLENGVLVRQLMREILFTSDDKVVAYRDNFRLVLTYEPVVLSDPGEMVPLLKKNGVYLITGGLGGIGLVLAQFLAEHYQARLVLTGRSLLPGRKEWDNWLQSHPVDDPTSQKIRGVKKLEILGAQVLVFSVDVTDYQCMAAMLEHVQAQFGSINGVIHAAGLPGGGIIQLKTREMADRVLLPKVRGTLVLENLLKKNPLDFIILCSSISSVVSDLGQVDYFSANAFMDAYAYYKTTVDGVFTISVNWDAWQEVGMAVEAAKETQGGRSVPAALEPGPLEIAHPLFEQYTSKPTMPGIEVSRKYLTHLDLEKHWPLKDHMTAEGKGLLPGTTYLEMARAAWESYTGGEYGPIEIKDVNFVVPMMINQGETREVCLTLEKESGENFAHFTVESTIPTEMNFIQKHAQGKIGPLKEEEPPKLDLEKIKARCNAREVIIDEETYLKHRDDKNKGLLVFGPHWQITKWTKYGQNEGLTMLQLPGAYLEELKQYKLHPSMLDSAAGFMYGYIHKGSAYIPFAYKSLRMYRPFPDKITSYSRLMENNENRKGFLKFTITVMDEHGNICAEIEEFTMLEVSEDIKARIKMKGHAAKNTLPAQKLNPKQEHLFRFGIRPSEGINIFTRILDNRVPQVIVSTVDLLQRLELRKKSAAEKYKDAENMQLEGKLIGTKLLRPDIGAVYAAPCTNTEKQVAEIWQNHLGIENIGIHDDFFELGGDSLKAITLTGKLQKMLKVEVPLAEFFNHPTVKQLAEFVSAAAERKELIDIEPVESKDYYVLSSAQERLLIMHTLRPMDTAYNIARGMDLIGDIEIKQLESVFKKLINRHESLRTSFKIINDNPVQVIHENVDFVIQYYDLTETPGRRDEIFRNFVRPFDLGKAPLLRVGLLKTGEKQYSLIYDIHHIIADLHSLLVIFNDDFRLLNAGKDPVPLKIQYKDYSEWQNHRKQSGEFKGQEEFWLAQFKKEIPVLNLPLDYERPVRQDFAGDWVVFDIESPGLKAFKEILQSEDATLFMGLMTVYNILLFKLSGHDDIVVGTPIAGRRHPNLQGIIGMFVNMLPLRNSPGNEKNFSGFLNELKKNALDAFENQDYQFDDLVERLALPRAHNRHPLFDVNFTLQTVDREKTQSNILSKAFLELETWSSKYDLSLELIEIDDILKCKFEYKTTLFKRASVKQYAVYFIDIIRAVSQDKNILLKDIKLTHDLVEPEIKTPDIEFKF